MQEAAALAQPEPVVELEDVVELEADVVEYEEPTKLMVWADSWDIDGECFRQLLEIIECEK